MSTTDVNPTDVDTPVLAVSEAALATVLEVRASEDDPAGTALRVEVTGSNMTEFQYSLELMAIAEAQSDDTIYTQGDHGEY